MGAMMARPTKYNEKLQKKADEYVDKIEKSDQLATTEGLALHLKINIDTVNEWRKIHNAFSVTVKRIKALQKNSLMEKGLKAEWNPTMAIFLLKANHGLVDRQVVHNIDTPENKAEELLKAMGDDD